MRIALDGLRRMLLLRRPRAALGSRARALCAAAGAHLAVLQLYRLQPAPMPPGVQPRLLLADGQALSAEDSAARLAEASDRGEVVLVTESTLRQLLGGEAEQGQQALSGGAAGGGGAGLLADGRSDGPGAAVARRPGVPEATLPATVSQETLPAVLAEHGVPLKDALAASAAPPPDWGAAAALQQGEAAPPQGPQLELLHAAADGDAPALEALLPQLTRTRTLSLALALTPTLLGAASAAQRRRHRHRHAALRRHRSASGVG